MSKNSVLFLPRWIHLGIIGASLTLIILIFTFKSNNGITETLQTVMHLQTLENQSIPAHQMLDLLQSSFRPWNETNEYVAACIPVGNQQRDLREWLIHHYHHAGIRRFYIFDNNAQPPMHSLTNEQLGIPREAITFVRNSHNQLVPSHPGWTYTSCQLLFGGRHRWMAALEIDEFLEIKNSAKSLETFLRPLEEYGGIGVQWKFYGSSGFLTRPKAGVRHSFYRCTNHTLFVQHIKTIWNTAFWTGYITPHHFTTVSKRPVVNTRLQAIPGNGPFNFPLCYDHLVVHHYILKSKEEFDEKVIRGSGDGLHKPPGFFKDVDAVMNMECRDLMKLNP